MIMRVLPPVPGHHACAQALCGWTQARRAGGDCAAAAWIGSGDAARLGPDHAAACLYAGKAGGDRAAAAWIGFVWAGRAGSDHTEASSCSFRETRSTPVAVLVLSVLLLVVLEEGDIWALRAFRLASGPGAPPLPARRA